MNKIKLNLSEIVIKDLNDVEYPIPVHKNVGNLLYVTGSTIEEKDFGRAVHRGETVEVTKDEIVKIYTLITNTESYKPWVMEQIQAYIQSLVDENLNDIMAQNKALAMMASTQQNPQIN